MAWKVDSVSARPSRPASNFMVGVQSPKSRPSVDAVVPFELLPDEDVAVLLAAAAIEMLLDALTAVFEHGAAEAAAAAVIVAKVVGQEVVTKVAATATATAAAAEAVVREAVSTADEAAIAALPGVPLLPLRSSVVKFENPWATMTSATLSPVASNGVPRDVAWLEFSSIEPPTAGSTNGTMPRRDSVVGRVGSLHIDGISTTKGLKFCSAACATVIDCVPFPSWTTISSAFCSLAQGLEAAKRVPIAEPASVSATPGAPLVTA